MSAETAWRIAMEAAAELVAGVEEGEQVSWPSIGPGSTHQRSDLACAAAHFAGGLERLPMPPAFRAEVEAEAEELRGMLARMVDHADAFDHGEAMLSYGGDVAEARALLSRLEAKGESHE